MQPYTLSDLLRNRYNHFAQELEAELRPIGIQEVLAVAQIVGFQARLLRYESAPDPDNPDLEKARHRTGQNLRRVMKELRQLQADRFLKVQLSLNLPGAASVRDIHPYLDAKAFAPPPAKAVAEMEAKILVLLHKEEASQIAEMKKRSQFPSPAFSKAQEPGRNSPCPCGSGQKYKRCCGSGAPERGDAPPVPLPEAA